MFISEHFTSTCHVGCHCDVHAFTPDWTVCQVSLVGQASRQMIVTRCVYGQPPLVIHLPGFATTHVSDPCISCCICVVFSLLRIHDLINTSFPAFLISVYDQNVLEKLLLCPSFIVFDSLSS